MAYYDYLNPYSQCPDELLYPEKEEVVETKQKQVIKPAYNPVAARNSANNDMLARQYEQAVLLFWFIVIVSWVYLISSVISLQSNIKELREELRELRLR